jgi:hypothetical protein
MGDGDGKAKPRGATMSAKYLPVIESVLRGVPWTAASAKAAGFVSIRAARERTLGMAHFVDDEGPRWDALATMFDAALAEIREAWGEPEYVSGMGRKGPSDERVAYWRRGDRIVHLILTLWDNTRIRVLYVGERTLDETGKLLENLRADIEAGPLPGPPADWWKEI